MSADFTAQKLLIFYAFINDFSKSTADSYMS